MSVKLCYLLVLLVAVHLQIVASRSAHHELPSFLKVCHRSDPKLNECIKESIEIIKGYLPDGIPELNIPSCEPLIIPEIVLDQGSGAVAVRSTYSDINVYGPSQFTIKAVKIDLEKNRVRIKLFIPFLNMTSKYTMEGRILLLPISGSGVSKGNYSNIDATATMQGEIITKDGEEYFNVKDFIVDFTIGHACIELKNLFNGDPELGDAMNLFLNDNWKNVANEIKPVLEDTIASLFKKFSNKIYHKYPIKKLLPP